MSNSLAEMCAKHDGITIPTIWVAFALSLLVHVAVLWQWAPRMKFSAPAPPEAAQTESLVVRLAPQPNPTPAPSLPATKPQPAPSPRVTPSPPIVRPKAAPPPIALNNPQAPVPALPAPTPSVAVPAPAAPPTGDLTSYIEAQRRARAPSVSPAPPIMASETPPAESEQDRANRIVAANLAAPPVTFGYDPSKYGGTFIIQRVGYNDAEFMFYGWNPEIRRNIAQSFEVKRGANGNIDIAVVRRMIAIIREQVHEEDFLFSSQRLGRPLNLSSRLKDNAELEDFLLREYFYHQRAR